MPKWSFFPEKFDEMHFIYVLEFMLILDKMQNQSFNAYNKIEIWGHCFSKVNQAFHTVRINLYIGCPGPEDLNKINMYAVGDPITGPRLFINF